MLLCTNWQEDGACCCASITSSKMGMLLVGGSAMKVRGSNVAVLVLVCCLEWY